MDKKREECAMEHVLSMGMVERFVAHYHELEKAEETCAKYRRILVNLLIWIQGQTVTHELLCTYRQYLLTERQYAPSTINVCVAAINNFLSFLGWNECRITRLRVQEPMFRLNRKEMSREEYMRLVQAACQKKDQRTYLVLITLASTGIRVSELKYITVESLRNGQVSIYNKGKSRFILLSDGLCKKLNLYAEARKIKSGSIFLTNKRKNIRRQQIWRMLKNLSKSAGVDAQKVFPHNLRHFFAVVYIEKYGDLGTLASLLGHHDINTTRIYIRLSSKVVVEQLSAMDLAV